MNTPNGEYQEAVQKIHEANLRVGGLRRAVMELHRPFYPFGPAAWAGCCICEDGHQQLVDFPCETYELARDWNEG